MTNFKKLMPLMALFVLLAGCTGGCDGREEAATPPAEAATPTPAETETAQPTPTQLPEVSPTGAETPAPTGPEMLLPAVTPPPVSSPAPTPEPTPAPPDRPSDETVLAVYQQAVEAFSWFQMGTLPYDEADAVVLDEITYYRVDYPGISSLTDLRGALKRLFSDELVDYLMPAGGTLYREVDGVLYTQSAARGADITKGGEQRQILWQGDSLCNVQVTVELLDPAQSLAVVGSEVHTFPYQKVGSDWIFTNFYLVR